MPVHGLRVEELRAASGSNWERAENQRTMKAHQHPEFLNPEVLSSTERVRPEDAIQFRRSSYPTGK